MRGLPFRATESEIMTFFYPTAPKAIHIHLDESGRASGSADVEFEDHESCVKAMEKDKQYMGSRYVELFIKSKPEPKGYGGGYDAYATPAAPGTYTNGADPNAPSPLMANSMAPAPPGHEDWTADTYAAPGAGRGAPRGRGRGGAAAGYGDYGGGDYGTWSAGW